MKRFFLFVFAAIAFAACTQGSFEEISNDREAVIEDLSVGFEGSDTRIQIDAWSGKTIWNKGDEVSVFYRSINNTKWQFTGETGDRIGTMKYLGGDIGDNTMGEIVVAYPYNANYRINPSKLTIDVNHPSTQYYNYRSYGDGGNIMVACSDFTQFVLKSVCGWVRLELTGNGERVEQIRLRGNCGEQIAGLACVDALTAEATLAEESNLDFGDDEVSGNIAFDNSLLTEIVLDCGEGVELYSDPTQFYIATLPQSFNEGITVEIYCYDGSVMTLNTANAIAVERNHIVPMESVAYAGEIPPIYELSYTTDNGEPVSLYSDEGFGGELIDNQFDAATGEGKLIFDAQVTAIPDSAFLACNNLTTIAIPDGIQSIGDNAFNGCSAMQTITIPKSISNIGSKAFVGCSGKATIDCRIGGDWDNGWFQDAGFSEVTLGENVTSTGYYAFHNCDNLKRVTVRSDEFRYFGHESFGHCDNLTEITLPASIEYIESSVFDYCENLSKVTYGGSMADWLAISFHTRGSNPLHHGGELYIDGEAVKVVTIPEEMTTIGYQLSGIGFERVVLHDDITEIGEEAFRDCDALQSITIPNKVAEIKNNTFCNCDALQSVIFGSRVTTIASEAFLECKALNSVYFPESITTIGERAFYCCESLEEVVFQEGVKSIGYDAFSECHANTRVVLPSTIVNIDNYAFNKNLSLKEVYCKAGVVPEGGYEMFANGSEGRKIYVPVDVMYDYKEADYWRDYSMDIVGYDFENEGIVINIFELAYRTNDGEPLDPYTTEGFGAEFMENIFDATTGTGVLKFSSRVTSIPERAFVSCTNLAWIDIPECIGSIGSEAFKSCTSMEEITVPSSVTSIGDSAFRGCTGKATIHCNNLSFEGAAFNEVVVGNDVEAIGSGAFRDCGNLKSITIGQGVKEIGGEAFRRCGALTTVYLPASIEHIGSWAFSECISMQSVYYGGYIGDWLSMTFENEGSNPLRMAHNLYIDNKLVTEVVIPESITKVGNQLSGISATSILLHDGITEIAEAAFAGCASLESVTIPSRVLVINSSTFSGCKSLKSVTIGKRVTVIGGSAFRDCVALTSVDIPNSVIRIESDAFLGCNSLTAINIPDSVTNIGGGAFYYCTRLASLHIGSGVATIEGSAFENCHSLTEVVIPEGVTSIGYGAFQSCHSLSSVTIPTTLSEVGSYAFLANDELTNVYISDLAAWCRIDFANNSANPLCDGENLYLNGELVSDLVIPEGVTSIGNYAFYNCNSLSSVTIPESVKLIGNEAFYHCRGTLTLNCNIPDGMNGLGYFHAAFSNSYFSNVEIGNSVTEIGDYAFADWNGYGGEYWDGYEYIQIFQMQTLTIGENVERIGAGAFSNCTNLATMYVTATEPATLNSTIPSACIIYVPYKEYFVYCATAGWKEYKSQIYPYDYATGREVTIESLTPEYIVDGESKGKGLLINGIVWAPVNAGNYTSFSYAEDNIPEGWRLPTRDELTALTGNYSGFYFTGKQPYSEDMPQIYLPANGYVQWPEDSDNERYYYEGEKCYYWSNERTGAYGGYALIFDGNSAYTTGLNLFENGCSVRYVKDLTVEYAN